MNGALLAEFSARDLILRGKTFRWRSGPFISEFQVGDPTDTQLRTGFTDSKVLMPVFHLIVDHQRQLINVRASILTGDFLHYGGDHYSAQVRIGGNVIFSQDPIEQNPGSGWTTGSGNYYGGSAPPPINIQYDIAYLSDAGAIANYDPSLDRNLAAQEASIRYRNWLATKGSFRWFVAEMYPFDFAYMPTSGGRNSIGLNHTNTALAIVAGTDESLELAKATADSYFAQTHIILESHATADRSFDRAGLIRAKDTPSAIASIYSRPTFNMSNAQVDPSDRLTLTPYQGPGGFSTDLAHQPHVLDVVILTTGELFYVQELARWAGYNALSSARRPQVPWGGLPEYFNLDFGQTRAMAWGLLQLLHAARYMPDERWPEKFYFVDGVVHGLARHAGMHLQRDERLTPSPLWDWAATDGLQPQPNPLKIFHRANPADRFPGAFPRARDIYAPWEAGFLRLVFSFASRQGYPAQSLETLVSEHLNGLYLDSGCPYAIANYQNPAADLNGNFFQTWQELLGAFAMPFSQMCSLAQIDYQKFLRDKDHGYSIIHYAGFSQDLSTRGQQIYHSMRQSLTSADFSAFATNPKWALVPPRPAKPSARPKVLFVYPYIIGINQPITAIISGENFSANSRLAIDGQPAPSAMTARLRNAHQIEVTIPAGTLPLGKYDLTVYSSTGSPAAGSNAYPLVVKTTTQPTPTPTPNPTPTPGPSATPTPKPGGSPSVPTPTPGTNRRNSRTLTEAPVEAAETSEISGVGCQAGGSDTVDLALFAVLLGLVFFRYAPRARIGTTSVKARFDH